MRRKCPTPEKIVFRNEIEAMMKAHRAGEWHGTNLKAYKCRCGKWHTATERKEAANDGLVSSLD